MFVPSWSSHWNDVYDIVVSDQVSKPHMKESMYSLTSRDNTFSESDGSVLTPWCNAGRF